MPYEHETNDDADLKAFETALRALRPRDDRLAGRRPWVAAEAMPDSPPVARAASRRAATLPGDAPCLEVAGHQFVCLHCGCDAPTVRPRRRWPWPAAFSTMTAVAAILLAMLLTRVEPPARSVAPRSTAERVEHSRPEAASNHLASANPPSAVAVAAVDRSSYLALRDQLLNGRDHAARVPVSWLPPAAAVPEKPLGYREQLDRLLRQPDLRGS